jgi:hypothetical protein
VKDVGTAITAYNFSDSKTYEAVKEISILANELFDIFTSSFCRGCSHGCRGGGILIFLIVVVGLALFVGSR